MAQHHLSQLISSQQLEEIFHISLTPAEYKNCLNKSQLISPDVGQLWTAPDIQTGLYIVLSGKVRLLDHDDEMIVALTAGQYFGEYTFFAAENLAVYIARAGVNVQLCWVPPEILTPLIDKYPIIRQQLWGAAQERCEAGRSVPAQRVVNSSVLPNLKVLELPPDRSSKKISKAYFPNPPQRVGQLWQRVTRRYPFYAQQSASDCGAAGLVPLRRSL